MKMFFIVAYCLSDKARKNLECTITRILKLDCTNHDVLKEVSSEKFGRGESSFFLAM